MNLVNMAMSEDCCKSCGKSEENCCCPDSESEGPEYPYCLKLYLGPDELDKLGVKQLPPLGSSLDLIAKVKVMSQRLDDDKSTMELQITDMVLGKPQKADHTSVLYDNMPGMGGSTKQE